MVRYYPNYKSSEGVSDIFAATTAAEIGSKSFILPPSSYSSSTTPVITHLEVIPENNYFLAAVGSPGQSGAIHIVDSSSNDLPYPASSAVIEVSPTNFIQINALKYRDFKSNFMIAVQGHYNSALMYTYNLPNDPPVEFSHGQAATAVEVFRFDDRIAVGGSGGLIKIWDVMTNMLIRDNFQSTEYVVDISWSIGSDFMLTVHK